MRYQFINDITFVIILLILILGKWLSNYEPSNSAIAMLIVCVYFAGRANRNE